MLIFPISRTANAYVGQNTEATIDSTEIKNNKQQLKPERFSGHKKQNIMRTIITLQTPTEARKHAYFSSFKNSKRVHWASHRHFK